MTRSFKIALAIVLSSGWVLPMCVAILIQNAALFRHLAILEAAVKGQPPPVNSLPDPSQALIEYWFWFAFGWLFVVTVVWSFVASRRMFR